MVDVRVYCLKGILTKNNLKIGVFGVFGVMFTDGEGWPSSFGNAMVVRSKGCQTDFSTPLLKPVLLQMIYAVTGLLAPSTLIPVTLLKRSLARALLAVMRNAR